MRTLCGVVSVLVLTLGMLTSVEAAPTQCTPGSCDDNNPCTTDTCDPIQGCLYTPISCDDGNACTVDSCTTNAGLGPATIFIGHDTYLLEHQYQKIGTLITTWGAQTDATGAAIDVNGTVYVANPAQGNNTIERRGPGNSNLGTINSTVNNQFIEDLGNFGGGFILAGTFEGDIYRINTTTGAHVFLFTTGQNFGGVTYDGTNIWTTGGTITNLVYKRNLSGTVLTTFSTGRPSYGIGYDPDDGTLWIGHAGGLVTHYTQGGALIGGFITAGSGEVIDGVELGKFLLVDGCQNLPVDCSDNNFCTLDACDPMTGCSNPPWDCNDNNPCTDDACNPQLGCVTTYNNASCDDSNFCTNGDVCSGGMCQAGPPLVCNDNNVCTTDSCDARFGCDFVATNGYCDDGDQCTIEDVCAGGVCTPGLPVVCNDNNPCTSDSLRPGAGLRLHASTQRGDVRRRRPVHARGCVRRRNVSRRALGVHRAGSVSLGRRMRPAVGHVHEPSRPERHDVQRRQPVHRRRRLCQRRLRRNARRRARRVAERDGVRRQGHLHLVPHARRNGLRRRAWERGGVTRRIEQHRRGLFRQHDDAEARRSRDAHVGPRLLVPRAPEKPMRLRTVGSAKQWDGAHDRGLSVDSTFL
jgi:hypothetical protein